MKYLIFKKGNLPYSQTFATSLATSIGPEASVLFGRQPHLMMRTGGDDVPAVPLWRQKIAWGLGRRLLSDPETLSFRQVLRAESPSIVLAQFGPTGASIMDACEAVDIPLITFFHGYDATEKHVLDEYYEAYRQLFSRHDHSVIAVSRSLRRILVDLGANRDRVFVSPTGARCDVFTSNDALRIPGRFLAVGRFVGKKAPYLTILAFSSVLKDSPDASLHMVGDGILLGPCKSLVRALGIEQSVSFRGVLSHQEVRAEMSQASIFLQHSIIAASGDQEGTPVSIMEAGASGLPVIATRHAGIPDVVIHERTGVLVEEHDIDSMANAMRALVDEPSRARLLGQQAAKRIHSHFDTHKLACRVKAIADWTMNPSKPKPPLVPDWLLHFEPDAGA